MNMNTEYCKKILTETFGGKFKRTRKYKEGGETIREFTRGTDTFKVVTNEGDTGVIKYFMVDSKPLIVNDASEIPNDQQEMKEWLDGEIARNSKAGTGTITVPKNKYLFALCNCDYNDNCFMVNIEPLKHWKKEHHLADTYEDDESEEIEAVCRDIGLSSDCESQYSFDDQAMTKTEAKKLLLARGFCENREFTEFITADEPTEKECRDERKQEQEENEQYKIEQEVKLKARTVEQVYVDENIEQAKQKLKILPEFTIYWLVSKYMRGYGGFLAVSPVKLSDGREVVLSSEYLRAYLVNERKYELVKDIMEEKVR